MPEFFAGLDVVGMQLAIERCPDEHEAAGCHDGPTQIRRAPLRPNACRRIVRDCRDE
jgi:hypothetical protein